MSEDLENPGASSPWRKIGTVLLRIFIGVVVVVLLLVGLCFVLVMK